MSASDYRKGAAGLTIRYAYAETSLGWFVVAATERGVCAAEVAERIGQPAAVRAVTRVCASNGVAIPRHRVARSGGELSGYRWGVARKRELLDRKRRRNEENDDT